MFGKTYETILLVMNSFYELCMSWFYHLYYFKWCTYLWIWFFIYS